MNKIIHPKKFVADPDVYVHAFLNPHNLHDPELKRSWEELHRKAKTIYDSIPSQRHEVLIPSFEFREVAIRISFITGDLNHGNAAMREMQSLVARNLATTIDDATILANEDNRKIFENFLTRKHTILATCCQNELAALLCVDDVLYDSVRTIPITTTGFWRIPLYYLPELSLDYLESFFDPHP